MERSKRVSGLPETSVSGTAPSKFVPRPHSDSQTASCKTEEGEDPDYTTPDKRERPLLFKPRRISKPKQENECQCGNNERDQNKEKEIGEHFSSAGHDRFQIPCLAEKSSASVCGVPQSPDFGIPSRLSGCDVGSALEVRGQVDQRDRQNQENRKSCVTYDWNTRRGNERARQPEHKGNESRPEPGLSNGIVVPVTDLPHAETSIPPYRQSPSGCGESPEFGTVAGKAGDYYQEDSQGGDDGRGEGVDVPLSPPTIASTTKTPVTKMKSK